MVKHVIHAFLLQRDISDGWKLMPSIRKFVYLTCLDACKIINPVMHRKALCEIKYIYVTCAIFVGRLTSAA